MRQIGSTFVCVLLVAAWMSGNAVAEKWSLHVGVNKYQNLPGKDLQGCVNDAILMRKTLVERFGFPETNAKVLADSDATATNIVATFRNHIIANSKPGDSVVFTFSGHGTQIPDKDGDEDDGLDESLCATDIGMNRDREIVNAVTDDMLRELCDQLADRHVLVILDCCHSGTGTRSLFSQGRSRFLSIYDFESDASPSDASLFEAPEMNVQTLSEAASDPFVASSDTATRSLGGTPGSLAFLSACKANELAQESVFSVGSAPQPHGAFTTKLVTGLTETSSSRGAMTYGELENWLQGPLVTAERAQHPQVEIPNDIRSRVLFGVDVSATPPSSTATPEPGQTASEPYAGVENVKVFLAHASVFESENSIEEPDLRRFLEDHLESMERIEMVGDRDHSNATVFYGTYRDRYTVGVLLPSGEIAKRFTLPELKTSELGKLDAELNRIYLVNGVTNLRNPARDHLLTANMVNAETQLRDGDTVEFFIRTEMTGYLTLVNITSEGGWIRYDPADLGLKRRVQAGETLHVPPRDSDSEYYVMPPYGDEVYKVLVTTEPLDLPEQITPQDAAAMFATRALGVRSREQEKKDLSWLAPDNFASATIRYRTYPR